jgi:hypothetical protein
MCVVLHSMELIDGGLNKSKYAGDENKNESLNFGYD